MLLHAAHVTDCTSSLLPAIFVSTVFRVCQSRISTSDTKNEFLGKTMSKLVSSAQKPKTPLEQWPLVDSAPTWQRKAKNKRASLGSYDDTTEQRILSLQK